MLREGIYIGIYIFVSSDCIGLRKKKICGKVVVWLVWVLFFEINLKEIFNMFMIIVWVKLLMLFVMVILLRMVLVLWILKFNINVCVILIIYIFLCFIFVYILKNYCSMIFFIDFND